MTKKQRSLSISFLLFFLECSVFLLLLPPIEDNLLLLNPLVNGFGVTNLVVTAINPVRSFVMDTVEVTVFGINDPPEIHELVHIEMFEDIPYEMLSLIELDSLGSILDIYTPV